MGRQDNFDKYLRLRKENPRFVFDSYTYRLEDNQLSLTFKFIVPGRFEFHPGMRIRGIKGMLKEDEDFSGEMLDRLVFHVGMMELVSYWKALCPPTIVLPENRLSPEELVFWRKLYFHGLGEFFYLNSVETDINTFVDFEGSGEAPSIPLRMNLGSPPLVPIGGGKDSAVTAGLLSRSGRDWIPFAINPLQATLDVIQASGKASGDIIVVERQIDPLLLELNASGYLNGHTPFSAVVAFYSLLTAFLTGSKDIVLSNESSANEPTIPGTSINHQYSKTLEFEKDFREYVRTFISPSFNYFSLLRPLTELQIGRMFSGFPEFHEVFRSCNVGSKAGIWCGKCPKCLFTWVILSPFLEQQALQRIFGKDLLKDQGLIPILDELTGVSEIKPFECIGTTDEVNAALDHLIRRYGAEELPRLLQHHLKTIQWKTSEHSLEHHLLHQDKDHYVPEPYLHMIKNESTD